MLPMCLDNYIETDSICRVIAAYVGRLDIAALAFKYSETKDTARSAYNPADILSLYAYGYINRIRSSWRLEREPHRNIEVMWLLSKLTPDDKTICNFCKDNSGSLKKAFRDFSLLCKNLSLYGKELIAIDGTKPRKR
ncbi:MAG: transposase [Oscillospiraceae bacterium]|jgi:transposase|nr:transposase [Oscillospiraceae bacterium]